MAREERFFQMGYLRGLTHGAIAGAILGLLYAPESGFSMRQRVSRLLGQAEDMMAADSGAVAPATPRRRGATGIESRARRP
ncbi:MAG: YtxH domain-containing protein [Chloroflexi bacterium]|nr:MAG: YtxH domain-containing protein [Chloroflexota bacterium]